MKVGHGTTIELAEDLDDDLSAEDGSRIVSKSGPKRVLGDIACEGNVEFEGSFECREFRGRHCKIRIGSLKCDDLEIRDGELDVEGDLITKQADVDKRLTVRGNTEAEDLEVGGILEVNSLSSRTANVGGKFHASSGVTVESIEVGGILSIDGTTKARDLEVGGKANLNGGEVSERIDVGGVFESRGPLKFGDLDVGGVARISGASSGRDVDVGGRFEVDGDITFDRLDIGGVADIRGNANGADVDIGGQLSISGSLKLSSDLDVGGSIRVDKKVEARSVDVGGSIEAGSLSVEKAELSGNVRTENGVFADRSVTVSRHSRVHGWIRSSQEIIVESHSVVESLSAPKVVLERGAKAQNLYGEEVVIEDRAEVSGEVLYVRSLEFEADRVRLRKAPLKVDSIPLEKSWSR